MITALDSSVILDVLIGKNPFLETSIGIMQKTISEGKFIVCECILGEVFPALGDEQQFREFMKDWQLQFVPSSEEST